MRTVMIGSILALASSLLLARAHPFGDARLNETPQRLGPILEHTSVPPAVRTTLETKCADCHSIQPRLPFYARLAPVSWLVERDIVEGRKAMNLSEWDRYSADDQQAFKEKILHETKSQKMPLPQYRLVHWSSTLTTPEIDAIAQWARGNNQTEGSPVSHEETVAGDAGRGKEVFQRRCTGCHALDENREGPHLRGVYGRQAGSVSGFDYSAALKQSHLQWNEQSLERWLTDPDAFIPGNNMDFHVVKAQERTDLIAFLKTMS